MRSLESITDSVDRNLGAFWETVRDGEAWSAAVHTVAESTERQLSNYFFKAEAHKVDVTYLKS